jgi:apolipoprotein D and lipocalin family protein
MVRLVSLPVLLLLLTSCQSIPKGAEVVTDFEKEKYLGTWYELARLDHRFERNLTNVTAEYTLKDDGRIKVINRGYDTEAESWKQAEGKAKFREDENIGKLKVSFFGPFYSGYNVIALDDDYQYAMIAGKDLDYLWLLSRKTTMPESITSDYLSQAENIGYDTSELIWVGHSRKPELE